MKLLTHALQSIPHKITHVDKKAPFQRILGLKYFNLIYGLLSQLIKFHQLCAFCGQFE